MSRGTPAAVGALARLVSDAEDRIARVTPAQAEWMCAEDSTLIDIRSEDARITDGVIPGSLHIPRTVLEWRVAIDSPWQNPHVGGLDSPLLTICDHGYSSILAAANLVALGFHRTGDVIGGVAGWRAAGLALVPGQRDRRADGELPGMAGPQQP